MGLISCAVPAQLICAFVFAYAKSIFFMAWHIFYSKKVLHQQIFTKIYKYHFFLSIPNLNFKFDTALEDSIQYLTL